MINEFDNEMYMTQNYIHYKDVIHNLSVTDIIKVYDYINTLRQFISQENEVLDDIEDILNPLTNVINKLMTDTLCPKCSSNLFLSDLPQYNYICFDCNENF